MPELEGLYRAAVSEYEGAFQALEVQQAQFERATEAMITARAAGDEAAMNAAYLEILQISRLKGEAERRVEEKAEELLVARERLLDATASHLQDLLEQAQVTTDPDASQELAILVADTRSRIAELRNLEDPPVTLEPLPDINREPRDGPNELRAKASILEITAAHYEDQHAYYERQLEGLRRDQSLLRASDDFLAGLSRFDDPTVPVRAAGSRTVPPPGEVQLPPGADSLGVEGRHLTLEERIQALESLQEEITQRIQTIRIRAETLRRLAGGVWA